MSHNPYHLNADVQLLQRAHAIGVNIDDIYSREQLQRRLMDLFYSGKYNPKDKSELEALLDILGWTIGML